MPLLEALSLSSAGKVISAIWANGSRFLWSISVAAAAAAVVLWLGTQYEIPRAQPWWNEYGLLLIIGSVVVAVLAFFKGRAERPAEQMFLIPDEEQSLWHHAKQQDGSVQTQFSLKFLATNRGNQQLTWVKVQILRPRVSRKKVLMARIAVRNPASDTYSRFTPMPPRSQRECHANLMIIGTIGGNGRTKPMTLKVRFQDNVCRWHRLVFVDLRDPQFHR
jgi:hypothetical protein